MTYPLIQFVFVFCIFSDLIWRLFKLSDQGCCLNSLTEGQKESILLYYTMVTWLVLERINCPLFIQSWDTQELKSPDLNLGLSFPLAFNLNY